MAIELVVATLNVSFDSDTSNQGGGIKLEIDDREDGYNDGETSFVPGDIPYFFYFIDTAKIDEIQGPKPTAGSCTLEAAGETKEVIENVSFTNSKEGSLSYVPNGSVDMKWLGKAFKYDKKEQKVTQYSTLPSQEGVDLRTPDGATVTGLLKCEYTTTGDIYKLTVEAQTARDFKEVLILAMGVTKE